MNLLGRQDPPRSRPGDPAATVAAAAMEAAPSGRSHTSRRRHWGAPPPSPPPEEQLVVPGVSPAGPISNALWAKVPEQLRQSHTVDDEITTHITLLSGGTQTPNPPRSQSTSSDEYAPQTQVLPDVSGKLSDGGAQN
jgi:hypothetical protein